ncbi:MAG: TonB-dependent receptor [Gammaproteobacteria bacterium]
MPVFFPSARAVRHSCSLVFAVLGLAPSVTIAADAGHQHPHPHALEEVVVTADPLGHVEGHLATPVSVLDGRALARQSMRSIGETVGQLPGVNSADFGASVSRPVIRGLGGARVRVLEDGIGTMDVSTISADHGVAIEPVFAHQVEVFRGPATLLYGSGASGGLVNVVNGRIPRVVPDTPTGGLYAHYDTAADGWMGAWQVEAPLSANVAVHADGLRRDTGDLDLPGFAAVSPDVDERRGRLLNSATATDNYALGTSWVGERGFVGFDIAYLANSYGVPGGHHHHEHEGEEENQDESDHGGEGGPTIALQQTRYDTEAALDIGAFGIDRVRTRWGYGDYSHDEIEGDGTVATTFHNEEIEGRLELVLQPLGAFDGVVGLQVGDRIFSANGEEAFVPAAAQNNLAGFVFEKADFGDVHIDAGLRYEHNTARDRAAARATGFNLLSLSGGATWAYRPGWALGLAVTRSQRAPTLEELFANGPHLATNTFERGSVALGEETAHNVDLSWRRTEGRVHLEANVFYNDIADFVYLAANDANGDGLADRVEADFLDSGAIVDEVDALLLLDQRQRDARLWGFELAVDTTLFEDIRGRLDLRAWSDYVDGELSGGETLPRLPPLRFGLRADWQRGPWSAGFAVTRVTDVSDPAPLETATDGYVMIDADVGYRHTLGTAATLDLFARATNLADQTARRHTSFVKDQAPLAGIGGVLGARIEF